MKLSVVILNWNAAQDTATCLRSVQAWEPTGLVGRPAIWVVDNGSRPPGIEPVRREFPDVHVVQSPTNRGFGGGSNLGIEAALDSGADAVLLLNNDASVDASSVATMLATLGSDPAIGVVGPTVWHQRRCVSAGGRDIARHGVTHLRLREPPTAQLDVDYVPGTIALVKRQVFEQVGLLDEDYFFGGEMADLCHRARLRGFRSVTDPRARAARPGPLVPGSPDPAPLLHLSQPVPVRPQALSPVAGLVRRALDGAGRPHRPGGALPGQPATRAGRRAERGRRLPGTLRRTE